MSFNNWPSMLDELLSDESDTLNADNIEFLENLESRRGDPRWEPSNAQFTYIETLWRRVFGS